MYFGRADIPPLPQSEHEAYNKLLLGAFGAGHVWPLHDLVEWS